MYRPGVSPTTSSPMSRVLAERPTATTISVPSTVLPSASVAVTVPPSRDTFVTPCPVRTSMPLRSKALPTNSPAAGSSTGSSRSCNSTTVTSDPSERHACAISTPMTPPPRMMSRSGTSCAETIFRESHGSESASPSMGGMAAELPVATTTALRAVSSRTSPSGIVTDTARSPVMRPCPRTSAAFTDASHCTCPSSFQLLAKALRACSARSTSMPPVIAPRSEGTRCATASASSGRSSALLGMHAQYEHSPPTSSDSTTAAVSPPADTRPATFSPAAPPPMITTSNSSAIAASFRGGLHSAGSPVGCPADDLTAPYVRFLSTSMIARCP